jgi:phosphate-selective porin OprO/OprP
MPLRTLLILALMGIFLVQGSRVQGQTPVAPPSNPDLEQRVRDLEETLRRIQAENARHANPLPAPGVLPAAMPTSQAPTTDRLGDPQATPSATTAESPRLEDGGSSQGSQDGKGSDGKKDDGKGSDSKKDDDKTPVAGWKDGFFLQSKNKDFMLRITGQIQADYRAYLNDSDQFDVDTFFLRRARFGLEATMFQYYDFRFLPDFGQGKAVIQDSYMNIHYWDEFQFEVGKFKQPVSYEQLIQDRFVPTLERSLIDQLVPARDVGVMLWGQKLFSDRLDWATSVSNGEINGDFDVNEPKDVDARIAVRPLNSDAFLPVVHRLQLGVSGGWGQESEPMNPNTLKTPAQVPWFRFFSGTTTSTGAPIVVASTEANGGRWRLTPELSYFFRGFGFAAQYYAEEQEISRITATTTQTVTGTTVNPPKTVTVLGPGIEVPFQGFYVLGTYLLTGEERTEYSQAIEPLRPFNPCYPFSCPGAWELVARVSRLEVGSEVYGPTLATSLADRTKNSRGATEYTIGFNWYFNRWARMQFNYEHDSFDQPVVFNPSLPLLKGSYQDTLMTRFQIIF